MLKWKSPAVFAAGAGVAFFVSGIAPRLIDAALAQAQRPAQVQPQAQGQAQAQPQAQDEARTQPQAFTALDYAQITQLINRYAYGIDTCGNNGYDYADVFTADGVFIDRNSDGGFAAGGRVLAQGREALATLVGGGPRGCATKLVWTDWSHLMLNHEITPTAAGATGRVYLVQLGMQGPGSVARHGGYEDVYVRTPDGWRIRSRTHVRDKAWHAPGLQTPDLK